MPNRGTRSLSRTRGKTRSRAIVGSYDIELVSTHRSDVTRAVGLDDIVIEYVAKILHTPLEYETGQVAVGDVDFYVVKLGLAADEGLNAMDACDAISQDLCDYAGAVLDQFGHYTQGVVDQFEIVGGDLLIIHTVTLQPSHRGCSVGLLAASRIIDLFGDGLVVGKPQPLQHVRDTAEHRASLDANLEYERFTKSKAAAKTALTRHWRSLGFERIGDSEFYGLCTQFARPSILPAGE